MRKGRTAKSRRKKSTQAALPEAEQVVLALRTDLMERLTFIIEQRGWTQVHAAQELGVTQSRISDLMRGKAEKFSLDMVAILAARAGMQLRLSLRKIRKKSGLRGARKRG